MPVQIVCFCQTVTSGNKFFIFFFIFFFFVFALITMDYKLVVKYLRKDELIYELTVRGIKPGNTKTVDELGAYLRPLINLEKYDKSITYPTCSLNFARRICG